MDVYVLGSSEVVGAMALAGLAGRAIDCRGELSAVLGDDELIGRIRILVIEEQTASLERGEIDRMKLDPGGPLIVEIPGIRGPGAQRQTPLDLVRHALGIEL